MEDKKLNEDGVEETLADKALSGKGVAPVEAKAGKSVLSKYRPGLYRSDKFMRIIKKLTYTHQKDELGRVQKTYGTWATDKNMIIFSKGAERRLDKEDLELPVIQRLIDSKVIYRVGE